MKNKRLFVDFAAFSLFILSAISPCQAIVVTFDDLPDSLGGALIPTSYQGLSWSNFAVVNAILQSNEYDYLTGANYGMVSPSNVAFNASGNPAEIDSLGTDFNFLSAYLTGAWNSNLNIEVQGFRSGALLFDTTVAASATSRTLFTFGYLDVDRLYFNSFGGEPAFGGTPREQFAMDNMTFEFVPEPSSLLLATVGALLLCPLLKRKRA